MGAFNINITGVGGHGCERKAKAGEKLHGRCGRFTCPDCMAYEFVQRMKQSGMVREGDFAASIEVPEDDADLVEYLKLPDEQRAVERPGPQYFKSTEGKWYRQIKQFAEFTHWPYDEKNKVVDDMLKNERKSGQF
jgi:hypothetical protein